MTIAQAPTAVAIQTSGRTDLEAFFSQSGVLDGPLPHHPLLLFAQPRSEHVEVVVCASAKEALSYGDDTPAMAQWEGTWRSDFFAFTVGDVRQALGARTRERLMVPDGQGGHCLATRLRAYVNRRGKVCGVAFYGEKCKGSSSHGGDYTELVQAARAEGIAVEHVPEDTPDERFTMVHRQGSGYQTHARGDSYDVVDTSYSADRALWRPLVSNVSNERARKELALLERQHPGTTTYADRPDLVEQFAASRCKR